MGRPTGVTVIAVLYFIGTAICLLGGLLFIAGGGFLATIINQQGQAGSSAMAGIMASLGAVMGVVFLVFGALDALVGWGLLKLKEWARLTAMILTGIGAALQFLGLVSSLTHFNLVAVLFRLGVMAVQILIVMYLLKPEVKAAFQGAARAASA